MNALKTYAMAGMTTVKYTHWNHFKDAVTMTTAMYRQKMLVTLILLRV